MSVLKKEREHLAEAHADCEPDQPDHECRCFITAPCSTCVECPSCDEDAWEVPGD